MCPARINLYARNWAVWNCPLHSCKKCTYQLIHRGRCSSPQILHCVLHIFKGGARSARDGDFCCCLLCVATCTHGNPCIFTEAPDNQKAALAKRAQKLGRRKGGKPCVLSQVADIFASRLSWSMLPIIRGCSFVRYLSYLNKCACVVCDVARRSYVPLSVVASLFLLLSILSKGRCGCRIQYVCTAQI